MGESLWTILFRRPRVFSLRGRVPFETTGVGSSAAHRAAVLLDRRSPRRRCGEFGYPVDRSRRPPRTRLYRAVVKSICRQRQSLAAEEKASWRAVYRPPLAPHGAFVDGRHLGLTQSAVPSRECRRRGPRDGAGNGVCLAPSKVPPRADPETPRRGDRRCPDPVGRGKGAFASDRRRAGRWRGRRPLSHLESDWQSPKGALPPRDRRVRAEAERRSRATVGVVFGVREAPRSCSELDSIAEAIERRPAVRTWREPGRCGLARSARARRREKAATKVPSPAGVGRQHGPKSWSSGQSSRTLDGERHSGPPRALALARGRSGADTARSPETGDSRQGVSEVLQQLRTWSTTPRRRGETPALRSSTGQDRSSSRGVNRRGTLAELAERRVRRPPGIETPRGGETKRKPRFRESDEPRVLVSGVDCRSRWKHLPRKPSASRRESLWVARPGPESV